MVFDNPKSKRQQVTPFLTFPCRKSSLISHREMENPSGKKSQYSSELQPDIP